MIEKIGFVEILDSEGSPSLLAIVILKNGMQIKASAPSNSIAPKFDNTLMRYQSRGLQQIIIKNSPLFQEALYNKQPSEADAILIQLKELGTNFTGALSIACAKAEAMLNQQSVYSYLSPTTNLPQIIVDITEHYSLVPLNEKPLSEHLRMVHDALFILDDILLEKRLSLLNPQYQHHEKIELILQAIEESGLCLGRDMGIFLNFAKMATFQNDKYFLNGEILDISAYVEQLIENLNSYPIVGFLNPLDINDTEGWNQLSTTLQHKIKRQVIVAQTNNHNAANIFITTPAYEGTIMETLENATSSKKSVLMQQSLHSTEDTFIADFAVGMQASFVKFGNIKQTEAYNRLLEIEYELL